MSYKTLLIVYIILTMLVYIPVSFVLYVDGHGFLSFVMDIIMISEVWKYIKRYKKLNR